MHLPIAKGFNATRNMPTNENPAGLLFTIFFDTASYKALSKTQTVLFNRSIQRGKPDHK
jgi:hypothetical protein